MKKLSGSNIRLAISIVFIVVMMLWGRFGNLYSLIRLHVETALPLILFIFGLYSLIRLRNKSINKSILIVALLAVSSLFYFNVIEVGKEMTIAYPVIAILIIYWLIEPLRKNETKESGVNWKAFHAVTLKWTIPFAVILAIVLWYRYGNPYNVMPYPADIGLLFALFILGLYALWQIRNKRIALSLIALVLLTVAFFFYLDVINLQRNRFFLVYPIFAMFTLWGLIQAFQKKEQKN